MSTGYFFIIYGEWDDVQINRIRKCKSSKEKEER